MKKFDDLMEWFEDKGKVLVSVSGGIDSALVAYAAFSKLGEGATAITADYKTLSQEELSTSKKVCKEIGIRQVLIEYDELQNADFVKNDSNRCYYCRSELASHLTEMSKKLKTDTIVDGTHLDDLGEYRPGILALSSNGIRSPLAEIGFSKKDVREIAKWLGISIYDKPSNSCLASRLPWGERVTAERLAKIEMAEKLTKQITGVKQIRVRYLNNTARVEFEKNDLALIKNDDITSKIKKQLFLIGFSDVKFDPEGYRSGKLNVIAD